MTVRVMVLRLFGLLRWVRPPQKSTVRLFMAVAICALVVLVASLLSILLPLNPQAAKGANIGGLPGIDQGLLPVLVRLYCDG